MTGVKYATWSTDLEIQFYAALAHIKINHDKLDDSARKVLGLYEVRPGDHPQRSSRMQIHGAALTTDEFVYQSIFPREDADKCTCMKSTCQLLSRRRHHQEL